MIPVEIFRVFVTLTVMCVLLYASISAFLIFSEDPGLRWVKFKDCIMDPDNHLGLIASRLFTIIFGIIWLAVGIYQALFG